MALGGDIAGGSLAAVKSIVDTEVYDRVVRDTVFEPITPLFSPRSDGLEQLQFPRIALGRLWRALKSAEPDQCAAAAVAVPAPRGRRSHADDLRRAVSVGGRPSARARS